MGWYIIRIHVYLALLLSNRSGGIKLYKIRSRNSNKTISVLVVGVLIDALLSVTAEFHYSACTSPLKVGECVRCNTNGMAIFAPWDVQPIGMDMGDLSGNVSYSVYSFQNIINREPTRFSFSISMIFPWFPPDITRYFPDVFCINHEQMHYQLPCTRR